MTVAFSASQCTGLSSMILSHSAVLLRDAAPNPRRLPRPQTAASSPDHLPRASWPGVAIRSGMRTGSLCGCTCELGVPSVRIRAIPTDAVAHRQLKLSQLQEGCVVFQRFVRLARRRRVRGQHPRPPDLPHCLRRQAERLRGLATAPSGWGRAAGSLLVGNLGDGRINIIAKYRHHYSS